MIRAPMRDWAGVSQDYIRGTKAAALLVLMATVENSSHPKALANTVKYCAFTRCAEMNLNGFVDAQVKLIDRELFALS